MNLFDILGYYKAEYVRHLSRRGRTRSKVWSKLSRKLIESFYCDYCDEQVMVEESIRIQGGDYRNILFMQRL
jgi:hypothetical protein